MLAVAMGGRGKVGNGVAACCIIGWRWLSSRWNLRHGYEEIPTSPYGCMSDSLWKKAFSV